MVETSPHIAVESTPHSEVVTSQSVVEHTTHSAVEGSPHGIFDFVAPPVNPFSLLGLTGRSKRQLICLVACYKHCPIGMVDLFFFLLINCLFF